jgi:hypothetical protein
MNSKGKAVLIVCGMFILLAVGWWQYQPKPTHISETAPISHTDDVVTVYPHILYEFEVETGTRVKGFGEFRDGLFWITEGNGNRWDGVELDRVYVIEPDKKEK